MKKLYTATQEELKKLAQDSLENACAYCTLENYKCMLANYYEAMAYCEILSEVFGIYLDDEGVDDHCKAMIDIIEEVIPQLKITRN